MPLGHYLYINSLWRVSLHYITPLVLNISSSHNLHWSVIDIPQGLLLLSLFSNILFGYVQMNALQAHDVFQFITKSLRNAIWLNVKSTFSVKLYFFPVFPLFLVVFCVICVYVCLCVHIVYFIYANKNIKTKKKNNRLQPVLIHHSFSRLKFCIQFG